MKDAKDSDIVKARDFETTSQIQQKDSKAYKLFPAYLPGKERK